MSRYPHPYQQSCEPDGSCGCCEPLDLEDTGSIFIGDNMEADCGDQDI